MDKATSLKAKRKRKKERREQIKMERLAKELQGGDFKENGNESTSVPFAKKRKLENATGTSEIIQNLKKKKKMKKKKDFTNIKGNGNLQENTNNVLSTNVTTKDSMKGKMPKIQEEKKLVIGPQKSKDDIMNIAVNRKKKKNSTPSSQQKPEKLQNINKKSSTVTHEGRLVFSKFDFLDTTKNNNSVLKQKGKDYKTLLEKVKKQNLEIEEIREKDPSKALLLQEKYDWKVAFARAGGEKVKNDEHILKKAMKRKEYKKRKTKKKWEERSETVTKRIDQRQKKRSENIKKKKQGRIDKKIKRAKKKGRLFSGF